MTLFLNLFLLFVLLFILEIFQTYRSRVKCMMDTRVHTTRLPQWWMYAPCCVSATSTTPSIRDTFWEWGRTLPYIRGYLIYSVNIILKNHLLWKMPKIYQRRQSTVDSMSPWSASAWGQSCFKHTPPPSPAPMLFWSKGQTSQLSSSQCHC